MNADDLPAFNFSGYFRKFTDEKTGKTKSLYMDTEKKIRTYFGANAEFEDATYTWLSTLEKTESGKPENKLNLYSSAQYPSIIMQSQMTLQAWSVTRSGNSK